MLNLVKDTFNPLNWIKLILQPKKIKIVFDRVFYYPGLRFGYSKSKLYRNFVIKFTIFLAKRNKNFQDVFFKRTPNLISQELKFDYKENTLDDKQFQSLKDNGIVILENVLSSQELNEIKSDFENNLEIKNFSEIKYMKARSIIMKKIDKQISPNSTLNKISSLITKKIYGKNVEPSQHYLYAKAIKLPEQDHPGDNIFHVDRFLPNLKMIYFPYKVDKESSPFSYALGSHKIDNSYVNFFLNNESWIFDERNPDSRQFLRNKIEIDVKENTLIIALTNGFHSRTSFKKISDRFTLFFTYPNFNLLSLFFPRS